MYFHYMVGIPVSQTVSFVFKGQMREQQNHLTYSKGIPRVTPAETQLVAKKPTDQLAGLSYSLVFSFHSGKERAV